MDVKVFIDVIPLLFKRAGIANYAFYVSQQFLRLYPDNEYVFYYGRISKKLGDLVLSDNNANLPHLGLMSLIKEFVKRFPLTQPVIRAVRKMVLSLSGSFDIYFEPNFVPLPGLKSKRIVTTVHDFSFHVDPSWTPKSNAFLKHFWRDIYRSDVIITDSDFIKTQALEFLKIESERIRSIPLGVNHEIFKPHKIANRHGLPENFILFVGSIQPRKNLKRLLQAYMALSQNFRKDQKLMLVGQDGWNYGDILELIKKNRNDIYLLDSIKNDSELARIYGAASVFICPSLYEGFGLPPLEAMACGCPTIVSNISSLPEVCGDAAYYIDPYDVENIADSLYRVSTDSGIRNTHIQKGLERAKLFTWEKTAMQHMKLFEEILG